MDGGTMDGERWTLYPGTPFRALLDGGTKESGHPIVHRPIVHRAIVPPCKNLLG
jgi:hypothetical protein